ncbi:RidA family protein [Methylobacterium indicum]|uniref:Enamine deaminase RidA n=1 Tax=Methylobacterium indicum TaxID=1775910 RepID=A0A8H8WYI0_9HYPH|nr:Rid family hydrolase [Methylobacterium indicum]BCM86734.1 enamine deaminase RidA [Methylobacterium indicum]
MKREIIEVPLVSAAIRSLGVPTSALVRCGELLYSCGMPPIDVNTGAFVSGSMEEQTHASLNALRYSLIFAGSDLDHILKTTVYVTDPDAMKIVNEVYASYFKGDNPARTSLAIKPWRMPFGIEIEAIAVMPSV